jgi:hypothetical protein
MKFYPLQLQLTCLGYLVCPDPNKNHSIGVALSKGAKVSTEKVTVEGNIANEQVVSSWPYPQTLELVGNGLTVTNTLAYLFGASVTKTKKVL